MSPTSTKPKGPIEQITSSFFRYFCDRFLPAIKVGDYPIKRASVSKEEIKEIFEVFEGDPKKQAQFEFDHV